MGKQEFAQMLEGIVNDSETASRVASADFADLASGELTGAEQALLTAAAGDLDDDVSGFAAFIKFDGVDGESWKVEEGDEAARQPNWTPNVRSAFGYLKL